MSANSLASSATLEAELSFLLAACSEIPRQEKTDRLRQLSREPVRWKLLFDLADRHGTRPLLYQALVDIEDAVPAAEMSALEQSYQTNLHKALFLSRDLIRIVDRLAALGIEVMPYKGLALAEVAYGDIALRQSGDIDLLIHPQDLPRICDAVRELGYTPHLNLSPAEEHAYLKSGYECAFDGAAGPNLLEVQWAIQPRFYAIDFDMDGLFRRAGTVTVAGYAMKTPSPEDLLLILSAHAAKHVWGRLVWLCDIARIMSFPTLDWSWIESQARTLGVVRIVRVSMLLANRLLDAAIPPAAQASLGEKTATIRIVDALVDEIQSRIASEASFNVESLAYFRLMMRLRERSADRLRFLQRLVFTPGPGEWQAVRLPAALFPLYRLVRLSRLAARLVRT
ncbi:MAG TPA: nucleotidyltransferase family protein [Candidatus Sulfotelmatobacter sp.]|nr:nucleotidyltransferase family protein [Candidatus Sulfotelmatobacter sp.]